MQWHSRPVKVILILPLLNNRQLRGMHSYSDANLIDCAQNSEVDGDKIRTAASHLYSILLSHKTVGPAADEGFAQLKSFYTHWWHCKLLLLMVG